LEEIRLRELEPCDDPGKHFEFIVSPYLAAGYKPSIDIISAFSSAFWNKFFELNHHLFKVVLDYCKKASAALALLISLEGLRVSDLAQQF
jgi:hypothetical protein